MKLLSIDIETAPAKVYVFSIWQPIIGIDQIIEEGRIICFSWQWQGEKKVNFLSEFHNSRKEMLDKLHELLNEADAVLHYNGKRFDVPWIQGELLSEGYSPVSPFKQIDLFQIVKSNSRFVSNKLDWVSGKLLGENKTAHTGFKLWKGCLEGDPKSWALMKKYSIQDTKLMLPLYELVKPYAYQHPNVNLYDGTNGCPVCGSENIQKRGRVVVGLSLYQQYQCQNPGCGKWFRSGEKLESTTFRSV